MSYRKGLKTLLYFTAFAILFFASSTKSFASDYQYKILDPRYNPSAEKLVDGEIPPVEEVKLPEQEKKSFDFGTFFAVCALVIFPGIILTVAFKAFREIAKDIPTREVPRLGNVKITPQKTTPPTKKKETAESPATSAEPITRKIADTTGNSINKYFTSPLKTLKNPMLLTTSPLAQNKGLCLVEFNHKYSLIGYIKDEIFLLSQFDYLDNKEIRSRLSEKIEGKDRYIVKLGDYKALVEVTDSNMNLLIEL